MKVIGILTIMTEIKTSQLQEFLPKCKTDMQE